MRDIFRLNPTRRAKEARQLKESNKKVPGRPRIAWRKRSVIRRNCTRAMIERATQKIGPLKKNLQTHQKGTKVPTKNDIGRCRAGQRSHLGRRGTRKKTPYETVNVKITKRITKFTAGLLPIKNWSLWSGRPPPKRKK
jgi:hypothetical protein